MMSQVRASSSKREFFSKSHSKSLFAFFSLLCSTTDKFYFELFTKLMRLELETVIELSDTIVNSTSWDEIGREQGLASHVTITKLGLVT